MGELRKLLAGMSNADREAALARYDAMFDKAESEDDLISRLGSPTFVALGELRGYVRPEEDEPPVTEPEAVVSPTEPTGRQKVIVDQATGKMRVVDQVTGKQRAITAEDVAAARTEAPNLAEFQYDYAPPEPEEEPLPALSKGKLALYILLSVLFGIPVTVVLVVLSLVILAVGLGVIAAGVFIMSLGFLGMDIFVDLMLLLGAGLAVAAVGLPIVFFAVWFFLRCVVGFINWVVRSGARWCAVGVRDVESADDLYDDMEELPADDVPPALEGFVPDAESPLTETPPEEPPVTETEPLDGLAPEEDELPSTGYFAAFHDAGAPDIPEEDDAPEDGAVYGDTDDIDDGEVPER